MSDATETCYRSSYPRIKGLGKVIVSRHARDRMAQEGIRPKAFETVLRDPPLADCRGGIDTLWREGHGIRIVIAINPTPNHRSAVTVKTVYRVYRQAKAR